MNRDETILHLLKNGRQDEIRSLLSSEKLMTMLLRFPALWIKC